LTGTPYRNFFRRAARLDVAHGMQSDFTRAGVGGGFEMRPRQDNDRLAEPTRGVFSLPQLMRQPVRHISHIRPYAVDAAARPAVPDRRHPATLQCPWRSGLSGKFRRHELEGSTPTLPSWRAPTLPATPRQSQRAPGRGGARAASVLCTPRPAVEGPVLRSRRESRRASATSAGLSRRARA
jgi:hypothetical protein